LTSSFNPFEFRENSIADLMSISIYCPITSIF
jgi:hypothetical protein